MLSLQKFAFDWTGLGYDFSSPSITSTSTTVFVPPANNIEIENNDVKTDLASENTDKGKSILGAPPNQDKKEAKNPRAKKANSQNLKQKKQHLCHYCGITGHTRPNCYKWLATQQSNNMIASVSQNQLQSSLAPLRDLLKALMFLSNLNGFNSSPSPPDQEFPRWKGSSKVWKEKGSKWFYHFLLPLLVFVCITCVFCFQVWVSLVLYFALLNMFLFVYFQFCLFCFSYKNKNKKNWK